MEVAQRLVFLLFCVSISFGQRVPQSFFERDTVTTEQTFRIASLDSIQTKTQAQREELALLYAQTADYDSSFKLLEELVEDYPDEYNYQFQLGGVSGILATEMPRAKSLPYVKTMRTAFEVAAMLDPNALDVQWVLLELYTELPWLLGGSNKRAEETVERIKSLSVIEGYLAEGYFFRSTKKNKEALVAYLNAINEIQDCKQSLPLQIDSLYHLGVLAFYLQKDNTKAKCLFSEFIANHNGGAAYPKSFARYYSKKIFDSEDVDAEMEATLTTYDKLYSWIQNNFK